ncbi:MAG TPA: hypothetical protein VHX60_17355 [Acidobacteriaceae bacterium]|nr:hypothetical protein [Acidobacteriaceae bacterium]
MIDVPAEAAVDDLVRNGIPPQVAKAPGQSFQALREGRVSQVTGQITGTVERVTGRPPRSFADRARQHAQRFA